MNQGFDNPQNRGLIPHPRDWKSCGAHAAYHALLCVGVAVKKEKAVDWKAANPFEGGIGLDPCHISEIVKRCGGKPTEFYVKDGKGAFDEIREWLNSQLDAGCPVIVGCENDRHWAVIAGRKGDLYYRIDSWPEDSPFDTIRWGKKFRKWIGDPPDDGKYPFIAVSARANKTCGHSLVPRIEEFWTVARKKRKLYRNWGRYLRKLNKLLSDGDDSESAIPAAEFFESFEEAIVRPVEKAEKAGKKKAKKIRRLYQRFRTVAEMHQLMIPEDAQTDFSMILRKEFRRQQ
jgi:hypothetical protein